MFSDRQTYSFTLQTTAPFHLGTGDFGSFSKSVGENEPSTYALIVRDTHGRPCIPSSSLKGAFRQRGVELGLEAEPGFAALFGVISNARNKDDGVVSGAMGLMLLHGRSSSARPDVSSAPYANMLANGDSFLAARSAIDDATGTAEDHKLFFQEMLPSGHAFMFTATVVAPGTGARQSKAEALLRFEAACSTLETILADSVRSPILLGRGKADGNGELAVKDGAVFKQRHALNAQGDLKVTPSARLDIPKTGKEKSANPPQIHAFKLRCEGPFLVMDSSVSAGRDTRDPMRDKSSTGPQIVAQRLGTHQPLLLGSSVSGALRSRAEWIADRFANSATDRKVADALRQAPSLLFGETGFAALCVLRGLRVDEAEPMDITSLRVDRFTGAPVDGALFTTRAFCGVTVSFSLHLTERPAAKLSDAEQDAAQRVFDALCSHVEDEGLMLGAGTGKGFGWFETVGRG